MCRNPMEMNGIIVREHCKQCVQLMIGFRWNHLPCNGNSASRFQIKNRQSGKVIQFYNTFPFLKLEDPNQLMETRALSTFFFDNANGHFRHNYTSNCLNMICKWTNLFSIYQSINLEARFLRNFYVQLIKQREIQST